MLTCEITAPTPPWVHSPVKLVLNAVGTAVSMFIVTKANLASGDQAYDTR